MFPFIGCAQPKDRGRSDGTIHCSYANPAFYWDTTEGKCQRFSAYCKGNQNKFPYRYQCEDACGKYGKIMDGDGNDEEEKEEEEEDSKKVGIKL